MQRRPHELRLLQMREQDSRYAREAEWVVSGGACTTQWVLFAVRGRWVQMMAATAAVVESLGDDGSGRVEGSSRTEREGGNIHASHPLIPSTLHHHLHSSSPFTLQLTPLPLLRQPPHTTP
ncbi:Cysteine-rich repeat secretory protein 11 [Senna tora]|uniref:Cysteine-rich repeat secretory protein 11 n=1 Tax=Senna tora TaxID=362788 RepID=A0A835C638_9FABA|nr:Cysteine-rich repeat secretory protein 11 [Senna tora]